MTIDTITRPDGLTDEHLEYLDELRERGNVNIFGATPFLIGKFGMNQLTARNYLTYWMKTFSTRHAGQE